MNFNKKQKAVTTRINQEIPIVNIYPNGVFEEENQIFSKAYSFENIAFKALDDAKQNQIDEAYQRLLNCIPDKSWLKVITLNKTFSADDQYLEVAAQFQSDNLNEYREAYNKVLEDVLYKTNIAQKKYMIFCTQNKSVEKAMSLIEQTESLLKSCYSDIAQKELVPLTKEERLELMAICYQGDTNPVFLHQDIDNKDTVTIDYATLKKQGKSFKDIIAPQGSMQFSRHFSQIGNRTATSLYLEAIGSECTTDFYAEMNAIMTPMLSTLIIEPVDIQEALKIIKKKKSGLLTEQEAAERKGGKASQTTNDLLSEAEALQNDLTHRGQKLFNFSYFLTIFAENEELAKEQRIFAINTAKKHSHMLLCGSGIQRQLFNATLPIGTNEVDVSCYQTTEIISTFTPYDELSLFHKNGIYIGQDKISHAPIVIAEQELQNQNCVILGTSGSGKSFTTKLRIVSSFLNSDEQIIIIDPDGEYARLANALGGTVISLTPGGTAHVNPMELDIDTTFDKDLDPLSLKTDTVCGIIESMLGQGISLTSAQKSIVISAIQAVYQPYIQHLQSLPVTNGKKPTIDKESCPTLGNLYTEISRKQLSVAQDLCLIMDTYISGTFSIFAHKSNVDVDNRLVVYDISNVGTTLKTLALKICLSDAWNKTMNNRRKNRRTRIVIDEVHEILSSPSSAEQLKTIWKRGRKWWCVPMAITQDVEDLLISPSARAILQNSSLTILLNQTEMDRRTLAEIHNLSKEECKFITSASAGDGLVITDGFAIPFTNRYPHNAIYQLICT